MKAKLVNKFNEGSNISSFHFKPEKPVKYMPGQFFYYTLPHLLISDPRGATRHFTAASSPTENYLMLTTRISESGYKQTLGTLKIGNVVDIDGPSGTFIIDEEEEGSHLLLAGGIGITPFRSIFIYHKDNKLDSNLDLIYSSRNRDDAVFYNELSELESEKLSTHLTLTKPSKGFSGNIGRIDAELIQKCLKSPLNKTTAWICGPPGFVNAMEDLTDIMGFKDVRSEKFTGY